ncbi:MAG: hypothetical protein ABI076_05585, partial [Acidobacteriaceae bacterium]
MSNIWPRLLSGWLLATVLLTCSMLTAEQIPVRNLEGTLHGFLVLSTLEGKTLAAGDLTQVLHGDRVTMRLVFHFQDGSIDDETTVFTQNHAFRFISDHHVQKGPSFPHPMDVTIDGSSGQVVVKYRDDGKEKQLKDHVDLPADLANGLLPVLLQNLKPGAPETKVSYLAATPKPRLVNLAISSRGESPFSAAGLRYKATQYVLKTEIGGVAGLVAPLIGKEPKDIHIWILGGI